MPLAVVPIKSVLSSIEGGGCCNNEGGRGTIAVGSELRRRISVPITAFPRARFILLG